MKQHEKHIEEERLVTVPASLDLTPYRDQKDFALLRRLVRKEKNRGFYTDRIRYLPRFACVGRIAEILRARAGDGRP
jgi:hypothetical protein